MVGKDGDLLDELFDQSLIEFCDIGFLLGDEALQLLDPVHGLFPVVAVDLRLFLLLPEPEDFIGDSIVVLLVVCLLDELLLQWIVNTFLDNFFKVVFPVLYWRLVS